MKAISPMIAVVLLIAFTVAVGGILSVWLSTLAQTQTSTVSSGTDKQVRCSASSLEILEVRYPTGSGTSAVNVTVRYSSGTETLANVTVEVTARGAIAQASNTAAISPGESKVVVVANANFPPEFVSAAGICQSTVSVTNECKTGQPCMKGSG